MAQSLKERFNGREKEVVAYVNTYGDGEAQRHFEIKDYIAYQKYKQYVEGQGYHFASNSPHIDQLGEQIVAAMRNAVLKDQTEIARLKSEITQLHKELDYYKVQKRAQDSQVIEQFFETINDEDGGIIPELEDDILGIPMEATK